MSVSLLPWAVILLAEAVARRDAVVVQGIGEDSSDIQVDEIRPRAVRRTGGDREFVDTEVVLRAHIVERRERCIKLGDGTGESDRAGAITRDGASWTDADHAMPGRQRRRQRAGARRVTDRHRRDRRPGVGPYDLEARDRVHGRRFDDRHMLIGADPRDGCVYDRPGGVETRVGRDGAAVDLRHDGIETVAPAVVVAIRFDRGDEPSALTDVTLVAIVCPLALRNTALVTALPSIIFWVVAK